MTCVSKLHAHDNNKNNNQQRVSWQSTQGTNVTFVPTFIQPHYKALNATTKIEFDCNIIRFNHTQTHTHNCENHTILCFCVRFHSRELGRDWQWGFWAKWTLLLWTLPCAVQHGLISDQSKGKKYTETIIIASVESNIGARSEMIKCAWYYIYQLQVHHTLLYKSKQPSGLIMQYTSGKRGPLPSGWRTQNHLCTVKFQERWH